MGKMNKYYLFLDECGDQNLANFDPSFPIFTLCGVLISEEQYAVVSKQVEELKAKFWDSKKVILHSRDIRKCQNGFEILFDLETKKQFYDNVNSILESCDYSIICASIKKEEYIRKYGKLNDVYALSLSFVMERVVFYLDDIYSKNIELNVVIEKRGKKEDQNLLKYYNQVSDTGTYWVKPERIKNYFKEFTMKWKKENDIGLQIADLVAYPITRFILDNEGINLAYDIVKKKIYTKNGKQYGLKIFP